MNLFVSILVDIYVYVLISLNLVYSFVMFMLINNIRV